MKTIRNILYTAITLVVLLGNASGQDCVRNISTNPDQPVNNLFNSVPGSTNPFLSRFNIVSNTGTAFNDVFLNPYSSWMWPHSTGMQYQILSPFDPGGLTAYSYLRGRGGISDADGYWEDGWELMWLNTGYFPNNDPMHIQDLNRKFKTSSIGLANPSVPYVIYYNRYSGKLRIFANVLAPIGTFDNFRTFAYYKRGIGHASGIFRHVLSYDLPLDQPSRSIGASAFNVNPNNANRFWSADIQLGYDPCVCHFPTSIDFSIHGFDTMHVDLYGRSLATQLPLQDKDGTPNYKDYLSNLTPDKNVNSGSFLYKNLDNLLAQYQQDLERYEKEIKQYNSPMNTMMRQLVDNGRKAVLSAGAGFVPQKAISDYALRQFVRIGGPEKSDTTNAKGFAEAMSNGMKGALGKGYDMLSVLALGDDFFKAPARPTMPTATFTESRFVGSITNMSKINVYTFFTPGSWSFRQQMDLLAYPAYDEAVGQYALLKTPSLKAYDKQEDATEIRLVKTGKRKNQYGYDCEFFDTSVTVTRHHRNLIRLNHPLLYKLNRVLDFDDERTQLYVSLEVEYENTDRTLDTSTKMDPSKEIILGNDDYYLLRALPPWQGRGHTLEFSTKWLPIEEMSDLYFDLDFKEEFQYVNTYERPLAYYGPMWYKQGRPAMNLQVKKVKLKVAADMYFNQLAKNGLQVNSYQVFTYLLYDADAKVDRIESDGIWSDKPEGVTQFQPVSLHIQDEVIEPTDPFVFQVIGNTLYISAEFIDLSGNIEVAPGYQAEIFARQSVYVYPTNTRLGDNIRIGTSRYFSRIGACREASESELQDFCRDQDNGYKALYPDADYFNALDSMGTVIPVPPSTTLYPNPSPGRFVISSDHPDPTRYHFEIYTLQGVKVMEETEFGESSPIFDLDVQYLKNGTYLLKVYTDDTKLQDHHWVVILH